MYAILLDYLPIIKQYIINLLFVQLHPIKYFILNVICLIGREKILLTNKYGTI